MAKIVVVEDEEDLRFSIARSLTKRGHEVVEAGTLGEARSAIERDEPEVVLSDINLNGESGLDLIAQLRSDGFAGAIIVMTAYGSVESAIEAMKNGADEYLQKPLSLEELSVLITRSLKGVRVRSELDLYRRLDSSRQQGKQILGSSAIWKETLELAERMARLPVGSGEDLSAILLLGETGSGKGLLARHIHDMSAQKKSPFVHVNCSAIPASLIESELFGHEKGAFTDARSTRQGLFELANGGTVFLDEIGDMPFALQSKLLLVIEQGVYRRIGGTKERTVNARVIAATNQDIAALSDEGKFRRDLFYRLNALTIEIPSLRKRGDDVIDIARALLKSASARVHREGLTFTDDAIEALQDHDWPGNVRELANAIHRAALLAQNDRITARDLGIIDLPSTTHDAEPLKAVRKAVGRAEQSGSGMAFDFSEGNLTAEGVEKELIVQALRHVRGNVSRAAKLIGMNRSSLRYRIERYELDELVQELVSQ